MSRWLRRLVQEPLRRVLASSAALGLLGGAAPTAAALPERSELEARVAEMRRHLQGSHGSRASPDPNGPNGPQGPQGPHASRDAASAAPALIAQAGRWNNWPNWSNWANWRNG